MKDITFPLLLMSVALASAAGAQSEPHARYEVSVERSVLVPMRDGVRLSTDLYFPVDAATRLPTILLRTPYNKKPYYQSQSSIAYEFAGRGYVVAVQDKRGKYESEGLYTISKADRLDGFDAVGWIASQPWSDGKVGTYGCSYLGENQVHAAAERHPNLTVMIPQAAGGIVRYAALYNGGAVELAAGFGWFRGAGSKLNFRAALNTPDSLFQQGVALYNLAPTAPEADFRASWMSLPVLGMVSRSGAAPSDFDAFVSHWPGDPWWNAFRYIDSTDRFDVPALHVNSWYDYGVKETLDMFNLLRTNAESPRGRDHQFAVISPTTHCQSERATEHTVVGERDVGDARFDHRNLYLRWFDYWLKGEENGVLDEPKLRIYVMGKNEWRAENEWPLARTRFTKYYLSGGGQANSRFGDGVLSLTPPPPPPPSGGETSDRFIYDPRTPVPSVGGPVCCTGTPDAPAGAFDQSPVEMRGDVLVYTTPPLTNGVEVTGPVELVLYVSSTAKDTDFTGKLVDVYPDGTAYNVQEGILRVRYREGTDRRVWMEQGKTYELRISLHATSNYFGPGHRIRLEVSSSNFPRFDRNLNTGGNNYDETEWVVATNTVHHSARYPSHLLLPVIP